MYRVYSCTLVGMATTKHLPWVQGTSCSYLLFPLSWEKMNETEGFAREWRSHHVDSIFVERVPVSAFGIVHQNLWLEGPSNGALLKGLTWKTEKKQCLGIIIFVQSDLWPSSLLRHNSLQDEGGQSWERHIMTAALIYDSASTEWPCLTWTGEKNACLQHRGKNPSKSYVT